MTIQLELAKKIIQLAKETVEHGESGVITYSKQFFEQLSIHVPTGEPGKERFERECRKIKADIHPDQHTTASEASKEIFVEATSIFNAACDGAIKRAYDRVTYAAFEAVRSQAPNLTDVTRERILRSAAQGSSSDFIGSSFARPKPKSPIKPDFSFTTCHQFITEFNVSTYSSQDKTELFTIFLGKCPQIIKTFDELFNIVRSLNSEDAKRLIKTLESDLITWVNTYDSFYRLLSISDGEVKTLIQTSIYIEFTKEMHRSSFYRFLEEHFKHINDERRNVVVNNFFQNPEDLKKLLQTSPELFAKVYPHCKRLINTPDSLLTLLTELTQEQCIQACRILRSSLPEILKEQANFLSFYQNLSLENFAFLCKQSGNFKPAQFIEFLTPPHDEYYNHLKILLIDIQTIADALSTAPEYSSFFNAMKGHFLPILFQNQDSFTKFYTKLSAENFATMESYALDVFIQYLNLNLQSSTFTPLDSSLSEEEQRITQNFLSQLPNTNILFEFYFNNEQLKPILVSQLILAFQQFQSTPENLASFFNQLSNSLSFIIPLLKEQMEALDNDTLLSCVSLLEKKENFIYQVIAADIPQHTQLISYITLLEYPMALHSLMNAKQLSCLVETNNLNQLSREQLTIFIDSSAYLWLEKQHQDLINLHKKLIGSEPLFSSEFQKTWSQMISQRLITINEKKNAVLDYFKDVTKEGFSIADLSAMLLKCLEEINSVEQQLQPAIIRQQLDSFDEYNKRLHIETQESITFNHLAERALLQNEALQAHDILNTKEIQERVTLKKIEREKAFIHQQDEISTQQEQARSKINLEERQEHQSLQHLFTLHGKAELMLEQHVISAKEIEQQEKIHFSALKDKFSAITHVCFNNQDFQQSESVLLRALNAETNARYTTAANDLIQALSAAKKIFIETGSIKDFKDAYTTAIQDARPILEAHSGWKKILQGLLNGLNALLRGLGGATDTLNKFGLFLKPRETSEKLTALAEQVNQL